MASENPIVFGIFQVRAAETAALRRAGNPPASCGRAQGTQRARPTGWRQPRDLVIVVVICIMPMVGVVRMVSILSTVAIVAVIVNRRGVRIVERHLVSVGIAAILIVADGVKAPVGMTSFPTMEALQPGSIKGQPDMVGSQIILVAAHQADIFIAVPDVFIRNPDIHGNYRSPHHGGNDNHR